MIGIRVFLLNLYSENCHVKVLLLKRKDNLIQIIILDFILRFFTGLVKS